MTRSNALSASACVLLFCGAVLAEPEAPAPLLSKGQVVTVAVNQTPLKVESDVLATFRSGEKIEVESFAYPWIWTTTTVRGKDVSGWVPLSHVRFDEQQWRALGATIGNDPQGNISFLDLSMAKFADADLVSLENMIHVKDLILPAREVSAAGAARLVKMKRLEVLVLSDCTLDDKDALQFRQMKSLQVLSLDGCKLEPDTLDMLESTLTQTQIMK